MQQVTILQAMDDPKLFGKWFKSESWAAWRAYLAALFALPMTDEQLALYRAHTGRQNPPSEPPTESWLCIGRRGGKSLIAALIATYLAIFRDYGPYLAPGETATLMLVAPDRRQARVILRYIRGFVVGTPMLRPLLIGEMKESLELSNGVSIEVQTASFKTLRGYTCCEICNDEISYFETSEDSAEPDREILAAERPALATIPKSLLLSLSSPYSRRGAMWDMWKEHYGKEESPVLFWRAASRQMNPSLSERIVAEAYERDPAAAAADYGAEFRSDIESFFTREAVERCDAGSLELPPCEGIKYSGFTDPSGGSSDSMTLGVAHQEGKRVILDCIRERRPPFSPEDVVEEFAQVLRSYRISQVTGDRYAGEWPRERFKVHGIEYVTSEKTKSELYLELLPLMNSGRLALLTSSRLANQLIGLERRTARGGRDSVDHAPGSHDDVANAAAGALVKANRVQLRPWVEVIRPHDSDRGDGPERIWQRIN